MDQRFRAISQAFRFAAFVDVLGWGSLTEGVPLALLKRMGRGANLSRREVKLAQLLNDRVALATRMDSSIRSILGSLHGLCSPLDNVVGHPEDVRFLKNSHVTYLRASDSIFAHSSSFQAISIFVAELLKQGLAQGVLLRAGIAGGFVHHLETPVSNPADQRTRDISIFGDAITSAVAAEKSRTGSGTRVWICPRLEKVLGSALKAGVRRARGSGPELQWWAQLDQIWKGGEPAKHVTPIDVAWLDERIEQLRSGREFDWNRGTNKGRDAVQDTEVLLRRIRRVRGRACV